MASQRGDQLQILVADGDPAFADAVSDAITAVDRPVTVEVVTSSDRTIARATGGGTVDGLIVGNELERAVDVIERVDERTELPAIFIADAVDDPDVVDRAVAAGADDYFPRTTAVAQYDLVLDIVAVRSRPGFDQNTETDRSQPAADTADQTYRAVFENVSDGLVVHDPSTGQIVDVNQRFCEMNGYDRTELVGEDIGIVTAPTEEYSYEAAHEKIAAAREEGAQLFEWRNQRRNGEAFPVEVHLSVVEIQGEQRVLASVRDITERRQLERRLRTITERVKEIIYLMTADMSEALYVNSAYRDIFGRPVDELYEDPEAYFKAVLPDDRDALRATVDAIVDDVESGNPDDRYEFEYRIQRPDGEVRRLKTTGYPILTEADEPHRYVSITEDVTGQKTREQRLTVLNRILRHNVRNALDVVLAHADHIDDEAVQDPIRDTATELLELSRKARDAEELMMASRGPPEPVDLREVAAAVADQFRTSDYAGEVSLDCPDAPLISSHRAVVQQALSELVENALVHTTEDPPHVEIRVRGGSDTAAEISVADDGPGLPERERQILASGTETQLEHGLGLGLWFVNWAVTQLGGDLQFGQNDPEGSIVTIRFYDIDDD